MTKLTEHFTLEEMTYSETAARQKIDNTPKEGSQERKNLQRVTEVMEEVRTLLGNNVILVSSGYRCPQLNKAVGGAGDSAHVHGLAADFHCPSFGSPHDIAKKIEPHMKELGIDQLIHEYRTWVHLGLTQGDPRCMALTIDHSGTKSGFA